MLRRLKTKEEIDKIRRRNNIIIGIVLIVLMGTSTFAYSVFSGEEASQANSIGPSLEEKGYEFFLIDNSWRFEQNGQVFAMTYLPSEVEDIPVEGEFSILTYTNRVLYLVNLEDAEFELLTNLGRYPLRYQESCVEGIPCEGDFPVKTCEDSVIIYEEGNETSVTGNSSCVYIRGDQIRGTDAFLYKLLNIN